MDPSGRVDTDAGPLRVARHAAGRPIAPDTIIAHGPRAASPDRTCCSAFQANEIVEEFECSIDGEELEGCEGVLELEGL